MSDTTKKFLVTAGLPYSNGRLHVGHIAGAYLPADIYTRYLRLKGHDATFVCGSDDHGVAILLSAEKESKSPQEIADFYHKKQEQAFAGLNIEFDVYGSTSRNPFHKELSQSFFTSLHDKGFFEKKTTKQYFDPSRDVFLPDRYVKGTCGHCDSPNQNGDQCENCGRVLDVSTLKEAVSVLSGEKATVKETVHWFLDLTQFKETVAKWLQTATLRDSTRNFVASLLDQGLVKRSMTRDISWGIPVPLSDPDAKGKVLYVWFDAPIGYISNTKQLFAENTSEFEALWKSKDTELVHFIGEDNTIFHCLIWIAMLAAEGSYNLPSAVVVNQFLNIKFPEKEEEKISKSRGTAVWIEDYLDKGGHPDVLRYYLTAIAPEKGRTVYKPDDLVHRNNTDLANTLGNFVNRILSFTHKYVGPQVPEIDESKVSTAETDFIKALEKTHQLIDEQLQAFQFKTAIETLMEFARECNRYVDEKAPWVTRKTDMETTKVTLAYGLKAIHFFAIVLEPFLPKAMSELRSVLKLGPEDISWDKALSPLPSGSALEPPQILFSKIEE